jgi:hypothetical protein
VNCAGFTRRCTEGLAGSVKAKLADGMQAATRRYGFMQFMTIARSS